MTTEELDLLAHEYVAQQPQGDRRMYPGHEKDAATDYQAGFKKALELAQDQLLRLRREELGGRSARRRTATYNYALNTALEPLFEVLKEQE